MDDLGRHSEPAMLVLSSLAEGPKHGYAIMEDVQLLCGTKLGPGTLYGALSRLEQRGLIAPLEADGRRRPYRITPAGEGALRIWLAALGQVVEVGLRRLQAASA
ncbi:MAG: PadR family transcriptional regulator [Solirubrobacteraceae bacterium]